MRIPTTVGKHRRAELRSPDPAANPYLAFALMIYAGLDGIKRDLPLPPSSDINLYEATEDVLKQYDRLPESLAQAHETAKRSSFIKEHIPAQILEIICGR